MTTPAKYTVGIPGAVQQQLVNHLVREDRQEDLCFATWRPSTGKRRLTAIVIEPILPEDGDRHVHGNASFESRYALRAARIAAQRDLGLVFIHAHPSGCGWQRLNDTDEKAEASIANLSREMTGLPLLGMTLACSDQSWGARLWHLGRGQDVAPTECESVRVVADRLRMTHNSDLRPRPRPQATQVRTIHAWGEDVQADLARLRVLVAGAGSVGMQIVESLARTGVQHIGVMDFDRVEHLNLDRITAAGHLDALLRRPKVDVAGRLLRQASTAENPIHDLFEVSVCEPDGLLALLDFDVIFSCVDRPWPRHVLNTVAYADAIPVIDGGLRLEPHKGGLRNAYWSSQVVGVGRPCLACIGQYNLADVQLERDGSLDDPSYIAGLPADSHLRANQNVSAMSIAAASAMLNQFLSLVVAPSGMGDPGPLRFSLTTHRIDRGKTRRCADECPFSLSVGDGDQRLDPTAEHPAAEAQRRSDLLFLGLARKAFDRLESAGAALHGLLSRHV